MCTVIFMAQREGYALGMNRDEKLTRVTAHPPAVHRLSRRRALFPFEPGGGTWAGVNDGGVTLALINWYSIPERVSKNALSRGSVVRAALDSGTAAEVMHCLSHLPLKRTNPFRLIGVFPQDRTVIEWRWNLAELRSVAHVWRTHIWISSGFDEAGAQKARRAAFDKANNGAPQNLSWLRALHACHDPAPGPYSICMHRSDAASVSYSEVKIYSSMARFAYRPLAPCKNSPLHSMTLPLTKWR